MKSVLRIFAFFLASLAPLLAQAQKVPATQTVVGVDFKVVIPESVQLTMNEHPVTTQPIAGQSLEVKTTVRGTCLQVTNRANDPAWSVDSDSPGWIFKRSANGYVFCTDQIGRVSLTLAHQCGVTGPWSVMVTAGVRL